MALQAVNKCHTIPGSADRSLSKDAGACPMASPALRQVALPQAMASKQLAMTHGTCQSPALRRRPPRLLTHMICIDVRRPALPLRQVALPQAMASKQWVSLPCGSWPFQKRCYWKAESKGKQAQQHQGAAHVRPARGGGGKAGQKTPARAERGSAQPNSFKRGGSTLMTVLVPSTSASPACSHGCIMPGPGRGIMDHWP